MDINNRYASAMRQGNLNKIRELIDSSDFSSPSDAPKGYNLLCEAIACGKESIVDYLLQRDVPVNAPAHQKSHKESPLNIAIEREDVNLVRRLLDLGADVNVMPGSLSRSTAIHVAMSVGNIEIIKLLVQYVAVDDWNIDYPELLLYDRKKEKGLTLLHMAVRRGYLYMVEHLLKRGTNVNSRATLKEQEGYTPLHIACKSGDDRIVKCLLAYGADVNAVAEGNLTPLHVVVKRRLTNLVGILLDHGANVNAEDKDNKTALLLAAELAHLPTVNCILKYFPDMDTEANRKSLNAVVNTYGVTQNKEAIITKLLKYGFTVKPRDQDDCCALRKAIRTEILVFIENFLEHCVDINSQFFRKEGSTLLHAACESGSADIVQRFLDKGAELDARANNGNTALYQAILWSYKDIVRLLLDRGADIDLLNEEGSTALCLAAQQGDLDILEMIFKRHPDVNNKGNKKSIRVATLNEMYRSASEYGEVVKSLYANGFSINPDFLCDSELFREAVIKGYSDVVIDFLDYGKMDFMLRFEPLHLATKLMNKDIIKLLISYGFNANVKNRFGLTPIHYAIKSRVCCYSYSVKCTCDDNCADIVETLLRCGADPNVGDINGNTPLHYTIAIKKCNVAMEKTAELLLRNGANLNKRCNRGKIPLVTAIQNGNEIFKKLFLHYTAFDFKNATHTVLLRHMKADHKGTVFAFLEFPLKSGADINSIDEYGESHLYRACKYGYKTLVMKLLEYGCDVSDKVVLLVSNSHPYYRDVRDILQVHITKLIAAGLKCSDIVLEKLESNTDLFVNCCRELETMKKKNVPGSALSFCDILTDDVTKLTSNAKNESLVQFVQSVECKENFPLYWSILKGIIWRGIVRKSLLEKSVEVFHSVSGIFCQLPIICIQHILSFLDERDLRRFGLKECRAFKELTAIEESNQILQNQAFKNLIYEKITLTFEGFEMMISI